MEYEEVEIVKRLNNEIVSNYNIAANGVLDSPELCANLILCMLIGHTNGTDCVTITRS